MGRLPRQTGAVLQIPAMIRRLQVDADLQPFRIEARNQDRPDFDQRPPDQQRIGQQQGQRQIGRDLLRIDLARFNAGRGTIKPFGYRLVLEKLLQAFGGPRLSQQTASDDLMAPRFKQLALLGIAGTARLFVEDDRCHVAARRTQRAAGASGDRQAGLDCIVGYATWTGMDSAVRRPSRISTLRRTASIVSGLASSECAPCLRQLCAMASALESATIAILTPGMRTQISLTTLMPCSCTMGMPSRMTSGFQLAALS